MVISKVSLWDDAGTRTVLVLAKCWKEPHINDIAPPAPAWYLLYCGRCYYFHS